MTKEIRTCINFGVNCVGCDAYFGYCIDDRRCIGRCGNCINNDCDNHPQNSNQPKIDIAEIYCYVDEL